MDKDKMEEESETKDDTIWDYVISFSGTARPTKNGFELSDEDPKIVKWKELQAKRKSLVATLSSSSVGLKIARKRSSDKKDLYILIAASQSRLETQAEHIELTMKLSDEYGGGFGTFEKERKYMFSPEDPDEGFFRMLQRIYLIETIIQGDPNFGGAGIELDEKLKSGVISKIFPMHNETKRKELLAVWANPKKIFKSQPLPLIRNYFGEEIALYFAWLGFYVQWLWNATIAGCIAAVFWIIGEVGGANYAWAYWANTVYAVYLSLWASFFLEYWKRYNNVLNWKWGTTDYKEREIERPAFIGESMLGVYHGGIWVPLEPDDSKYEFKLPTRRKYYPTKIRRAKIISTLPLIGTMICVLVVVTFAVLSLRILVQKESSVGGSIVGGALNAISILIMNQVWQRIAVYLNSWENHRT